MRPLEKVLKKHEKHYVRSDVKDQNKRNRMSKLLPCTLLRVLLHARAATHLPFRNLQGRRYHPLRRKAMDPRVKELPGPDAGAEWTGGAKPKKKNKSNKVAPAPTAVGAGDADAAALVSARRGGRQETTPLLLPCLVSVGPDGPTSRSKEKLKEDYVAFFYQFFGRR